MTDRLYRLSPPDRTGIMFGLNRAQVTTLGAAVVAGVVSLSLGLWPLLFVALILMATVGSFVRVGDQLLIEALPVRLGWATTKRRGGRRWVAPLVGSQAVVPHDEGLLLPPPFDQQVILTVDGREHGLVDSVHGIGVVFDELTGNVCAVVRAIGKQFALVERHEQDRLVAMWGQALSAFCQEATAVVAVRWIESASPAGVDEQLAYLDEHRSANPNMDAVENYEGLLANAGPMSTRHETLITISVSTKRLSGDKRKRGSKRDVAVDVLMSQLRLFMSRLDHADLAVSNPLSPGELAQVVRTRLAPNDTLHLERQTRTLAERAHRQVGGIAVRNAGPLATEIAWDHWRVGDSVHRALYVADWPRQDVPASWMQDLVLYGATVRSFSVHYEPVSPRKSRTAVARQASKLESDAGQRHDKGFRIDASHRRAAQAATEREEELVGGYGEFQYVGIIAIAASSVDELERATDELVQLAACCGIDARPLDGRHDQGVVATLPLAWGLQASN